MASSSSAAMKTSLVFMLLLGAVVAAHASRPVLCKNECPFPIEVCGVKVEAHAELSVAVPGLTLDISVRNELGVVVGAGSLACPADVSAAVLLYNELEGCVEVKVGAVGLISKLLHTVVGTLLGLIKCGPL